jgi:ABC-type spermidine/putrescine transport system permease subunit I
LSGRIASERRALAALLTLPLLLYLIPVYLAALGFLALFSVYEFTPGGRLLSGIFTIENYVRLLRPQNLADLERTILTAITAALASPIGSRARPRAGGRSLSR